MNQFVMCVYDKLIHFYFLIEDANLSMYNSTNNKTTSRNINKTTSRNVIRRVNTRISIKIPLVILCYMNVVSEYMYSDYLDCDSDEHLKYDCSVI